MDLNTKAGENELFWWPVFSWRYSYRQTRVMAPVGRGVEGKDTEFVDTETAGRWDVY